MKRQSLINRDVLKVTTLPAVHIYSLSIVVYFFFLTAFSLCFLAKRRLDRMHLWHPGQVNEAVVLLLLGPPLELFESDPSSEMHSDPRASGGRGPQSRSNEFESVCPNRFRVSQCTVTGSLVNGISNASETVHKLLMDERQGLLGWTVSAGWMIPQNGLWRDL